MPTRTSIFTLAIFLLLSGCEGFFGVKTNTDFLDVPVYDDRTVAYVPIQPAITGLVEPVDVIAGWDELIYVADKGTEEIIAYDQAANELGRYRVPGLIAIAQDRRFDMLASGTIDTLINGTVFTLPALYRLNLNKPGPYGIQFATISNLIVHPFYFKSGTPTTKEEQIRFTSIAIKADNQYYVSRSGPSNSTTQFGGPDDAVLRFDAEDKYIAPVLVSTDLGAYNNYFKRPSSITTFAIPPQSPAVNRRGDFFFTSVSPDLVLKVQGIEFNEGAAGADFRVLNFIVGDTSRAEGFLYEPDRFDQPTDVTVAGDGTGYIFVVDATKDSLYQFNGLGFEGVNPPAGSNSTKAILTSFGGTGTSLTQFRNPQSVAYLDRIVYVADAGNGRVLRFKLTTDFQ
jgi:hypothetical protein